MGTFVLKLLQDLLTSEDTLYVKTKHTYCWHSDGYGLEELLKEQYSEIQRIAGEILSHIETLCGETNEALLELLFCKLLADEEENSDAHGTLLELLADHEVIIHKLENGLTQFCGAESLFNQDTMTLLLSAKAKHESMVAALELTRETDSPSVSVPYEFN